MLWILLYSIAAVIFVIVFKNIFKSNEFDNLPGPPGLFLINNSLDFLRGPVKTFYYFRELTEKYKRLFKLKIGPKKVLAIYDPEDVEIIFSDPKFITKGYPYKFIKPWLAEGLALSTGSKWQFRRKLLAPAFYFNVLSIYKLILEENSKKLVEKLKCEVGKPKTNVEPYLQEFTLNSICETAMGIKLDEETQEFAKAYKHGVLEIIKCAIYRSLRLWMFPNIIFNLSHKGRKQKEILTFMNKFRDRVIDLRREAFKDNKLFLDIENTFDDKTMISAGKKRLAMLDLLLQAEKEGDIDADGIKEEVDTFMFGGHDTVATALQYALMVFANYPHVQERAVKECNELLESLNTSPFLSDLSKLKYLECCIKECLRLYPSVPVILRSIEHRVKLRDYEIPAGTECCILIYDLHRREDQFPNAKEFHPERFMTDKPTWHPYAYIPFSAGPRNCIGQKFAIIEMKLALSTILRSYKLLAVTRPQDVVYTSDLMLRSTEPIYVKFEERKK
ncbi:unnamed protein product [Parnassius mnemosyne]|uniref:Cytochrome P450 n=1 Tax=Parnassius mnemosyne TaxID=213953 RepID=A0AAV1M388_9NEOP